MTLWAKPTSLTDNHKEQKTQRPEPTPRTEQNHKPRATARNRHNQIIIDFYRNQSRNGPQKIRIKWRIDNNDVDIHYKYVLCTAHPNDTPHTPRLDWNDARYCVMEYLHPRIRYFLTHQTKKNRTDNVELRPLKI